MNKYNSGHTLIEILIAALLAIPIVTGGAILIKTVAFSYLGLLSKGVQIQASTKMNSYLLTIAKEYDQHRLQLGLRIHKNGGIRFADNSLNPISLRTDSLKPDTKSDAITSASIKILNTFTIEKADISASPFIFYGCPKFGKSNQTLPASSVGFIGISTDTTMEFIGSTTPWPGQSVPGCLIFSLTSTSGMLFKKVTPHTAAFIAAIIPIDRIYTIYIDSLGRLRYLGHEGNRNVENQPLAEGPIAAKLNLKTWPKHPFTLITARYWPGTSDEITHFFPSHLGRESHLNFLLN